MANGKMRFTMKKPQKRLYYFIVKPLMNTIEHECLPAGADNAQKGLLWIMESEC